MIRLDIDKEKLQWLKDIEWDDLLMRVIGIGIALATWKYIIFG